ncbi:MAG: hypothetical protein GTN35_04305 [Nitrososphaeria archaeon]|nr:hypothetical protein [Nitrosopumilaceae archaeon]NIP10566.1 hypothetical protein [Nitrosopumilaceae archaeon]NIP91604.1 hypothetical protein [Nitrososphaeria archaeon]NIS95442.1 hypothetical protein [Nitrosopumilaceae archaeon]
MAKLRSIIIVMLVFAAVPVYEAQAHSMFNSAESFLGGYRVQVATLPEFPQIGEQSTILLRVTDNDFEEVDRFTLGVRFFYNNQQIDAFPPESYQGGHVDKEYVWKNSGNHIVRVDLYDMEGSSGVLTYTFNMGTQSPFGQIFFISIIVGALVLTGVVIFVYFPRKLKFKSSS